MVQKHLSYKQMTDLGCFYTPEKFVVHLINMIEKNVNNLEQYVFLDSSCGYSPFLSKITNYNTVGCDIDEKAVEIAKQIDSKTTYYVKNALFNFDRKSLGLENDNKIIVIGNPPYNDTTSKVKNELKDKKPCEIDSDLKTRDLGISFMLSYNKMQADYVAILHPLSYLIKKANYDLLKPFFSNYSLVAHSIINSQEFSLTSKTNGFPIIIALYKRDKKGLAFNQIENMEFTTIDNEAFNFKFDFIKNYLSKYPSKQAKLKDDDILFFTMRDINALNRSRTFIQDFGANSIVIDKDKFAYYCYVDVFKQYINRLPYYYGNIDVFIDNDSFKHLKDVFITNSVERHPWLKEKGIKYEYNDNYLLIDKYFKRLFGG